MVGTGLSETPAAYRIKLVAQDDAQIDAWVAGSLRDIAKRRGVVQSVHELSKATAMGRDAEGQLIFPAVALWAFVPGIRAYEPKLGRDRLISFLVATFEEVVYI